MNPFVELLTSFRTQTDEMTQTTYVHEQRGAYVDALRARAPDSLPSDDDLRVTTRLDNLIGRLLRPDAPHLVFLTGDAGDGKTALCAELARRLGKALDEPVVLAGGWTIVKDASEIPEAEGGDGGDLKSMVTAHLSAPTRQSRLLVAINEGRLRRLARSGALGDAGNTVVLPSLEALDEPTAAAVSTQSLAAGVLVLNFRQRFVVRELVRGFLTAWTRPTSWEQGPCRACPAQDRCPILANVQDLRESRTHEAAGDALVAVYFTGQRLPVRRVQAVLALAVTGGLGCKDVIAPDELSPLQWLRHRFHDVVFAAPDGPVRPEPLCATLRPYDPGLRTSRNVDDALALALGEDNVGTLLGRPLPGPESRALTFVRASTTATTAEEHGRRIVDLSRAIRRWAWFTGVGASPPWNESRRLLEVCATNVEATARRALLDAVVMGLNRVLGVRGAKRDRISRHLVDPGGLRDPARAGLELDVGQELEVDLRRGPHIPAVAAEWLESCGGDLVLEAFPRGHAGTRARLGLDLRMVEALIRVNAGDAPASVLGPDRRRLARFVSRLIDACREASLTPRVSIRTRNARLTVSIVEGVPARLALHLEG